jgi:hypothetical protein
MKEELVSFKTAILAKEKGFNWGVLFVYKNEKISLEEYFDGYIKNILFDANNGYKNFTSAPSQSLLHRWLREVHDIFINVNTQVEDKWTYRITYLINGKHSKELRHFPLRNTNSYNTYEKALEAGLREALTLIK